MLKTELSVIVAAVALTACTFDQGGLVAPAESLHQRLGVREALVLEQGSDIAIAAKDGEGNALPDLAPTIRTGHALLRSTDAGLLLVENLELSLADIQVPPGVIYSEPVHLTDVEVRLGTQIAIDAQWGPGGRWAAGTGSADLLLDWSVMARDGDVFPLATQRMQDVDFDVYAELQPDGTVLAYVDAHLEGYIRSFGNRVELSDFTLDLEARTPQPTVE